MPVKHLKGLTVAVVALLFLQMPAPLLAEQRASKPSREVTVPLDPLPFDLKGYLREPDGDGPFPAVLLLPMCGALLASVDLGWGGTISSWGYVVLTLDVFTARGIKGGKSCLVPAPPETDEDVYRALNLLVAQKSVDRRRIFVMGFGRSGSVALSAVERDAELKARHHFRGAIALYPSCGADIGIMRVASLVIVGARDESTSEACRKMAMGDDDIGISRQRGQGVPIKFVALSDAYSGFDIPAFGESVETRERRFEFSESATRQSREIVRQFLRSIEH